MNYERREIHEEKAGAKELSDRMNRIYGDEKRWRVNWRKSGQDARGRRRNATGSRVGGNGMQFEAQNPHDFEDCIEARATFAR